MSKLHKKMVALGDMSAHTYSDIVAACGEPKETKTCVFTDIGEGTRSTWSDGVFTITFNFDPEGNYTGIYFHRNWEPYIWMAAISAVLIAAALIIGAVMRKNAAEKQPEVSADAAAVQALLLDNQELWRSESTAGISLIDIDFDGCPELLATDARMVWYEDDQMYYFGDSTVCVWSLLDGKLRDMGAFITDEYCFLASLNLGADASGAKQWYYTAYGQVWTLSLQARSGDAASATDLVASEPVVYVSSSTDLPDVSGGSEPYRLVLNESWVSTAEGGADPERVNEDICAVVSAYYD